MLKIKLARFGKKKQPHYRIVVNEARDKRDGESVDTLGQYAPTLNPKILVVDTVKFHDWIKKGAQPTDTVRSLVARFESGTPFPPKKNVLSRKAKAKIAKTEAEAANQPTEPVVETASEPVVESSIAEAPAAETPTEEVKE
jgi:small subunit ribosomal protein S16